MKLLKYVLVGLFAFTSLVGLVTFPCLVAAFTSLVRAPTLYNAMAQSSELAKHFLMGWRKFESYDFEPSELSFGTTGVIYRARFRPQHALPHEVRVSYTGDARVRWAGAERAAAGFSARFVVRHGQTAWEFPPQDRMPIVRLNSLPETLFIFRVGEFDWRYDDEIELTLEVLSPVSQDSYLRTVKPKLTVHELPYLF